MQLKAKEAVPVGSTVITAIHNLDVLVSVRFVIKGVTQKFTCVTNKFHMTSGFGAVIHV